MNHNTSVTLNDLSIGYKNKQGIRVVAEHLTANIHQGCLTCLLGENGVGKSTLLKTFKDVSWDNILSVSWLVRLVLC